MLKTTQLGRSRAGLSPGILVRSHGVNSYATVPDTWIRNQMGRGEVILNVLGELFPGVCQCRVGRQH